VLFKKKNSKILLSGAISLLDLNVDLMLDSNPEPLNKQKEIHYHFI